MLIITRRENEALYVGDAKITILEFNLRRGTVRLGIDAPKSMKVLREELVLNGPQGCSEETNLT